MTYDVAVIGGGIVGLAVTRELHRRNPALKLIVVERETSVAIHQSGHNSGVIHGGIYYRPGSLKAKLCVEGARRMVDYCAERSVPYELCGKLIVALTKDELPALDELERKGRANGVPELRRLNASELKEVEPNAAGIAAIHSPKTGIVDFSVVAHSLAAELMSENVEVLLGNEITGLELNGRGIRLSCTKEDISAKYVINCAGAWADRFAIACGAEPDPRIVPFRGQYLKLKPEAAKRVNALIYPVPDPALPFLGVHFTRRIQGDVLLGPNALLAGARDAYNLWKVRPQDLAWTLRWPGTWRMARRWWRTGITELRHTLSAKQYTAEGARYLPGITVDDVLPGPSGVRGQAVGRDGSLIDDFVISQTERALHVRNAPSPAGTASLALADVIVDRAEDQFSLRAG